MSTRVAKGRTGKATKTARRELTPFTKRIEAVRKTLEKRGRGVVAWIRERVPEVRAGLERFGKSAAKTATRIEVEVKDDVKAVRKRLAEAGKAAPDRKTTAKTTARKTAATKTARKPAARKATPARKAPARRKAAAKKAPAARTAARKKAATKGKSARAA